MLHNPANLEFGADQRIKIIASAQYLYADATRIKPCGEPSCPTLLALVAGITQKILLILITHHCGPFTNVV